MVGEVGQVRSTGERKQLRGRQRRGMGSPGPWGSAGPLPRTGEEAGRHTAVRLPRPAPLLRATPGAAPAAATTAAALPARGAAAAPPPRKED